MDDEIGRQYLDQFDSCDLSEKSQRRLAVYGIREFYATTMADVAREYLQIDNGVKRRDVSWQWDLVLGRLESLEGLKLPRKFEFGNKYNKEISKGYSS